MIRRWLYLILAVYVALAAVYSVVTPIFEASDELWHYPMVQYLAAHGLQLPPQTPGVITDWRQEGSQPPLYYLAAAVITAPIDTSDLDLIRRQNPHADIGLIRPDGNVNMIVHHPALEAFPWRGTMLAVHVARFFSIALGLGTVIVTYRLARELFRSRPEVALGAAALNAFLPMFLFISGSVNNDNLSNLLGNLLLLLIVLLLKAARPPRLRDYALIGVVAGAGLLSKLSIGALIPLVVLALLILTLRFRDWRPLILGGLISGGLTLAIAGWWYLRNAQLVRRPNRAEHLPRHRRAARDPGEPRAVVGGAEQLHDGVLGLLRRGQRGAAGRDLSDFQPDRRHRNYRRGTVHRVSHCI